MNYTRPLQGWFAVRAAAVGQQNGRPCAGEAPAPPAGRFHALPALCLLPIVLGCSLFAQARPRIIGDITDLETFPLAGNTKPVLALAQDQGEISAVQPLPGLSIRFSMTSQQRSDLEQLLSDQQTPGSPQFHKFLTPEEYGARFGLSSEDTDKITTWLERQGFSNIQVARSRSFITFKGTVGIAQVAFHTSIHKYTYLGKTHYANVGDPLLPMVLEPVVESVSGLQDFHKSPLGTRGIDPQSTSHGSGKGYLMPDDFATIYNIQPLYRSGLDGSGVKIAVVGQSDIKLSDIRAFRSTAGLPAKDPEIILAGDDPGVQSMTGDETESDLDLEWAGGIARNATIVFVTSTDVDTSITYAIDNDVAPIISISYGACERDLGAAEVRTESSQYAQASAQGITVLVASGDQGAASCDRGYVAFRGLSVDVPASFPNVTGIGGTTFTEGSGTYWSKTNNDYGGSALSYIPETAWNDSSWFGGLASSGGGASLYNSKPSWQTGKGVPADGSRDVPDLAFSASAEHDGYLICTEGSCASGSRNRSSRNYIIGGTSAGAPSFAGIVALMVQSLGRLGNINPRLYSLAASSTDVFHDITSGSNIVRCVEGSPDCSTGTMGFSAGPGYDQVTGLGSVDADHLLNEWNR